MTCHCLLTALAKATTPLVVVFVAACAGGQEPGPADASPSPPDSPGAAPTTTPTVAAPPASVTCENWNGLDFFASASADLVQECLQAGAHAHDPAQQTPAIFRAAAAATDPRVIHLLVDAGADLRATLGYLRMGNGYRDGYTPLHTAAALNPTPGIIDALVSAGADPDARDREGATALHTSWTNPSRAVARALLRSGGDPLARDQRGRAADPTSCSNWTTAAFARLALPDDFLRCLADGENVQAFDSDGDTPLHLAVEVEGAAAVGILLDAGADLTTRNNAGATPLHVAATHEDAEILILLLEAGADINAGEGGLGTPLLYAIATSRGIRRTPIREAPVNALLESGADVNAADSAGNTPLLASLDPERRAGSLVDLPLRLLALGANPNSRDGEGRTPLYMAVAAEGSEVIHALLEAGADPHALTDDGSSPLHAAAESGSPEVITLLAGIGLDPDGRNADSRTPLHLAIERNNTNRFYAARAGADGTQPPSVLRALALLQAGADPNARTAEDDTPLHLSVWHPDSTLVFALAEAGADVHARNAKGETPLHKARAWDSRPAMRALLDLGADPDARDYAGLAADPVCWGAGPGRPWGFLARSPVESVRGCLATGIPVDARDEEGATFLARLVSVTDCCTDFENVLAAFLEAGADVNARDNAVRTPLHRAITGRGDQSARASVISALLEAGADPSARDSQGSTPLHILAAEWWSSSALVPLLAEAGADLNSRNNGGETPLHIALRPIAAFVDDAALVQTLVQLGADPAARDSAGNTADPVSCERWGNRSFFALADADIVAGCIAGGANVRVGVDRFPFGLPPLHAATATRDPAVISVLLEAGADVHARDDFYSYTPLHPAAAAVLLEAGADVNSLAAGGRTPLHEAAASASNPAVIELLVAAGADVNAHARNGYTPLHSAAWYNPHPEITIALIAAGADVNARDPDGYVPSERRANDRTPLFMAVYRGGTFISFQRMPTRPSITIAEVLVRAGADLQQPDGNGRTPLHAAAQSNPAVFPLLLRLGADPNALDADGKTPMDYALENRSLEGLPEVLRMREAMRGAR